MLFKKLFQVHLDEPTDGDTLINGVHVSGWCTYYKSLTKVFGSINNKEIYQGVVDTYMPNLKSSFLQKSKGFFLFFPQTDEKLDIELFFEFKDGSRETFRKSFHMNVQKFIDKEDYPYQIVLHNAGGEGSVLKRKNIYGYGPPVEMPTTEVLSMILHYAGERVLDVGCGIGVYVEALTKAKRVAKGIEVNEKHVERAQSLNRDVTLYDGRKIPFEDSSFDTVSAIEVLEHVEAWEDLLKEMIRVTNHNILLSVPNIGVLPAMSKHVVVPWHILESTHVNFFTRDILAGCLSRIKGISFAISTYAPFRINDEIFYQQLAVVIEKQNEDKEVDTSIKKPT